MVRTQVRRLVLCALMAFATAPGMLSVAPAAALDVVPTEDGLPLPLPRPVSYHDRAPALSGGFGASWQARAEVGDPDRDPRAAVEVPLALTYDLPAAGSFRLEAPVRLDKKKGAAGRYRGGLRLAADLPVADGWRVKSSAQINVAGAPAAGWAERTSGLRLASRYDLPLGARLALHLETEGAFRSGVPLAGGGDAWRSATVANTLTLDLDTDLPLLEGGLNARLSLTDRRLGAVDGWRTNGGDVALGLTSHGLPLTLGATARLRQDPARMRTLSLSARVAARF